MITEGNHFARIVDYGMKKSKAGNDMVFVSFETNTHHDKITWFGSLKPGKATEITIDTLLTLGFTANWKAFAEDGSKSDCFENPDKTFELVVENNTWEGRTSPRIKYINDPSKPKGSGAEKATPQEAVSIIKSMNLEALTLQRKQETQGTKKSWQQSKTTAQTKLDEDFDELLK